MRMQPGNRAAARVVSTEDVETRLRRHLAVARQPLAEQRAIAQPHRRAHRPVGQPVAERSDVRQSYERIGKGRGRHKGRLQERRNRGGPERPREVGRDKGLGMVDDHVRRKRPRHRPEIVELALHQGLGRAEGAQPPRTGRHRRPNVGRRHQSLHVDRKRRRRQAVFGDQVVEPLPRRQRDPVTAPHQRGAEGHVGLNVAARSESQNQDLRHPHSSA